MKSILEPPDEHFDAPDRNSLSRQSRNQTGKFGHIASSAVRVILDDPPIHIHPDIPAARGCKPNEPCGFTPFRLTHDSILGALPPVNKFCSQAVASQFVRD